MIFLKLYILFLLFKIRRSFRFVFFFQAEDGIRDGHVTGVQTCALPISGIQRPPTTLQSPLPSSDDSNRSEEHTSELQSRGHLVCRLLLEKKKNCHNCQFSNGYYADSEIKPFF